jgi:hypothetical protein
MILSKEQVNALRTHLKTVLIRADSTHDIHDRLTIIIEGLNCILTSSTYKLPHEIKLLLGRLEGRAYSPRVFQSDHRILMHAACSLLRSFIPSQDYTLSKEHELVDELVQLLVPAAEISYQAKTVQRLLSCLFPIDVSELKANLSIRYTSPVSRQLVYMFKTVDAYTTALYCPFIDAINRYAEDQNIDELVYDCTDLLEKPEYGHMLPSFSDKLSELKAYVEAESPDVGFTLLKKKAVEMGPF